MTKKWKSYLSSPEIESNFHLSVKSKGCLRFYLATFPNNYCLHNASHDTMPQWAMMAPPLAWSVLVRASSNMCTSTGKLVIKTQFYISGMKNVKFLLSTCHEMGFSWSQWNFWSQELNSYFFCFKTNIYVCQIDMNIPNLFMELHEIITSHLWPSEKISYLDQNYSKNSSSLDIIKNYFE